MFFTGTVSTEWACREKLEKTAIIDLPQRLSWKEKKWENDHAINEQITGCRL